LGVQFPDFFFIIKKILSQPVDSPVNGAMRDFMSFFAKFLRQTSPGKRRVFIDKGKKNQSTQRQRGALDNESRDDFDQFIANTASQNGQWYLLG